ALEQVRTQAHIHTRFPVIKSSPLQDTRYKVVDAYLEIKDGIGLQRQAINRTNPPWISAPHNSTGYQRVDIAVGQYDEASTQCRKNLALEAIYKVRGIEQVQR